jgi:hypothetical protein
MYNYSSMRQREEAGEPAPGSAKLLVAGWACKHLAKGLVRNGVGFGRIFGAPVK